MPTMSLFRRSFQSVVAISGIFLAALGGAHLNNPEMLITNSFARAFTADLETSANVASKVNFQTSWVQTADQQVSWQIVSTALHSSPALRAPLQHALNKSASVSGYGPIRYALKNDTAPTGAPGLTALLEVGNKIVLANDNDSEAHPTTIILEITDVTPLRDNVTRLDTSLSQDQWVRISARLEDGSDSQIVQFIVELPPGETSLPAKTLLSQNPAQVL